MAYPLGDIFIGNYPVTQAFGARPDVYSARYNLKGHNGIDFGCPSLTPILSTADGYVSEIGFDAAGYGKYLKIVHGEYLTLYAHLNDITVKQNDRVVAGQLIAHSNNTGFSDAPHLHFAVAPCDQAGIKTQSQNGYSGYIDPNSSECDWNIKDLKAPIVPGQDEVVQKILVPSNDFTTMVAQGSNYKVIVSYLLNQGLNNYLTSNNIPVIDLEHNPKDPVAGENVVKYLSHVFIESDKLKQELEEKNKALEEAAKNPGTPVEIVETTPKEGPVTISQARGLMTEFFAKLRKMVEEFVFVKPEELK